VLLEQQDGDCFWGMLYTISPDGSGYSILRSFPSYASSPGPNLIEARDGFVYGVTKRDGTDESGTVFRLRKDGSQFSTVCNFTRTSIGRQPVGGLVEGRDGRLYGVTAYDGANGNGAVFSVVAGNGECYVVYSFATMRPTSALTESSDGCLVGSATGGEMNLGIIYRLILPEPYTDFCAAGRPGHCPSMAISSWNCLQRSGERWDFCKLARFYRMM